MYIMNICDVPSVMEILRIVNIIITIIKIFVPILLIISAMVDFFRTIMNSELSKISKSIVKKVIAAVIIFFIPTIISVVVGFIGNDGEYKKCLTNITKEEINEAYSEFVRDLVDKAEESLSIYDYNNAKSYLYYVKNPEERNEYEERLKTVKKQIDAINRANNNGNGVGYPNKTYGKCDFVEKSAGGMSYGICVPNEYNNQSIPMIVWLHGSGEVGCNFNTFKGSGMLNVVRNWGSTGLEDIPAIIVAPHLARGDWSGATNGVRTIMDQVMSEYNINRSNVALIGHSLGGSGVVSIASANQSYFSSITILSGYFSSPPANSMEYFKNIPIKGYSESGTALTQTKSFFRAIGKESELRTMNCSHGAVPREALILDENNDNISDLIYWMLSSGSR